MDISRDVIPITKVLQQPIEVPVGLAWACHLLEKKWATGLYAAGRSAHNGMHGEGILPGNQMLDDLVGGNHAGHAGLG